MAQNSPYPDNSFPAYTEPTSNYYADNNLSAPRPIPLPKGPGYPAESTRARGPSLNGLPIPSTPPVQNATPVHNVTFAPPPQIQTPPNHQQQPHIPSAYQPQQSSSYPQQYSNNYQQPYPADNNQQALMRPPVEPRRLSASSAHSRHSHDSHRSGRSSTSRDGRRSGDHDRRRSGDYDRSRSRDYDRSRSRDYDRDATQHKQLHHHGDKPKRNDHRPTWGDTIYGIFGAMKTSLRPSD